jgi:Uma2 family endonuclease
LRFSCGPGSIRNNGVVIAEFGLDADPVDRTGGGANDYTATAPVLLAEVLSPSSVEIDLGDKAAEYLKIPSLLACIVLSQEGPKAWIYARSDAKFAAGSAVISGAEATIQIAALQLELPTADIYAGL